MNGFSRDCVVSDDGHEDEDDALKNVLRYDGRSGVKGILSDGWDNY